MSKLVTTSLLNRFKTLLGGIFASKTDLATLVGSDAGKSARTIANEELAAKLIGDNAKESLDTLTEIAAWIQSHPDDVAAINSAITALQNKLNTGDQTVTAYVTAAISALNLGELATKDEVAESDLATTLLEKVNAAAQGNHSHSNKSVLDNITAEKVNEWNGKSDFSGNYADLIGKPEVATEADIDDMFA